jgi:hypothetical protein
VFGRIKGTVLVGCVKALRKRRAEAGPLLSARAQELVLGSERVLPSSWYDEELAFELYRAFARIALGGSSVGTWHEMGRLAALGHAAEIYRHLIRTRDTPRIMTEGAVVLFSAQHDTGKLSSELVAPGEVRVQVKGFGAMCPEWCHMIAGYLVGLAESTGAEKVHVRHVAYDFAAKDASYTVTWHEVGPG